MDEETPGRAVEAVSGIIKGGLLRYFDRSIGNQGEADRPNRFQRWLHDRAEAGKAFISESFSTALQDKEVQEQGTEYVAHTVGETVQGIKQNFKQSLDAVNDGLKIVPEDTRSTYQRVRDFLGHSKDDKWYTKIGKNALARVFGWSVPIVSFVSARVAGKMTNQEKSQDIQGYRDAFGSIFNRLLSKLSPQKTTKQTSSQ